MQTMEDVKPPTINTVEHIFVKDTEAEVVYFNFKWEISISRVTLQHRELYFSFPDVFVA